MNLIQCERDNWGENFILFYIISGTKYNVYVGRKRDTAIEREKREGGREEGEGGKEEWEERERALQKVNCVNRRSKGELHIV